MTRNIEKYIRAVFEENVLIENSARKAAIQLGMLNLGDKHIVISLHLGKKTGNLTRDASSLITARTNRFFEEEPFYIGEVSSQFFGGKVDPDNYQGGRSACGTSDADRIFGRFLKEADFSELKDKEFAEMVTISRAERMIEKPCDDRTYRFLRIDDVLRQEEGFGKRPSWSWHGPQKKGKGFPYNDGLPHFDGYEYIDFVLTADKYDVLKRRIYSINQQENR